MAVVVALVTVLEDMDKPLETICQQAAAAAAGETRRKMAATVAHTGRAVAAAATLFRA
ncbi:MAG: hypothetical protein BWY65_02311 [Firmicutes bacterium ADurb.Bin373]|nr:MAG: hypothetical protein BWY65_02311 [Firmicutes bacterium ADurb.Bin373]